MYEFQSSEEYRIFANLNNLPVAESFKSSWKTIVTMSQKTANGIFRRKPAYNSGFTSLLKFKMKNTFELSPRH